MTKAFCSAVVLVKNKFFYTSIDIDFHLSHLLVNIFYIICLSDFTAHQGVQPHYNSPWHRSKYHHIIFVGCRSLFWHCHNHCYSPAFKPASGGSKPSDVNLSYSNTGWKTAILQSFCDYFNISICLLPWSCLLYPAP